MMLSPEAEEVRSQLRAFYADLAVAGQMTLAEGRAAADGYNKFTGPLEGIIYTPVTIGSIRGIWADAPGADPSRVIQFQHGGGYMFGSAEVYKPFTGHLSAATGCRVLSVDYRLVPEHPHPAPVTDVTEAYQWLLSQGYDPSRIVLAGNSAGAGLTLALLLNILGSSLPVPAGLVAFSPMADMELNSSTWSSNIDKDVRAQGTGTQTSARLLVGEGDPRHPLVSPVHGDYAGGPPLYISAGSDEVFLDDARAVAAAAERAGAQVVLDVVPGFHHDFEIAVGRVPEADDLFARVGSWVRALLA